MTLAVFVCPSAVCVCAGVYTSSVYQTSRGYSQTEQVPVAIVEVCTDDPKLAPNNITAVPDADCVCVKFLIVHNSNPDKEEPEPQTPIDL